MIAAFRSGPRWAPARSGAVRSARTSRRVRHATTARGGVRHPQGRLAECRPASLRNRGRRRSRASEMPVGRAVGRGISRIDRTAKPMRSNRSVCSAGVGKSHGPPGVPCPAASTARRWPCAPPRRYRPHFARPRSVRRRAARGGHCRAPRPAAAISVVWRWRSSRRTRSRRTGRAHRARGRRARGPSPRRRGTDRARAPLRRPRRRPSAWSGRRRRSRGSTRIARSASTSSPNAGIKSTLIA